MRIERKLLHKRGQRGIILRVIASGALSLWLVPGLFMFYRYLYE